MSRGMRCLFGREVRVQGLVRGEILLDLIAIGEGVGERRVDLGQGEVVALEGHAEPRGGR